MYRIKVSNFHFEDVVAASSKRDDKHATSYNLKITNSVKKAIDFESILGSSLAQILNHKGSITRQDVITSLKESKDNAQNKINVWIQNGILTQEGHGRGTIYLGNITPSFINQDRQFVRSESKLHSHNSFPERLKNKKTINRQDVINELGLNKHEVENKINAWVHEGILIKEGHGRNTVYRNTISGFHFDDVVADSSKRAEKHATSYWDTFESVCIKVFNFVLDLFEALSNFCRHRGHKPYSHMDSSVFKAHKPHHSHKHVSNSVKWRDYDDYGDPSSPEDLNY